MEETTGPKVHEIEMWYINNEHTFMFASQDRNHNIIKSANSFALVSFKDLLNNIKLKTKDLSDSTIELLQLDVSQGRIHDHGPRDSHPDAQISAILSHHLGDRPNVPDLVHGYDRTSPPDEECRQRSEPNGQLGAVSPRLPVKAPGTTKDELLLERNCQVDSHPISHEGEEILKDIEQVIPSSQSASGIDKNTHAG